MNYKFLLVLLFIGTQAYMASATFQVNPTLSKTSQLFRKFKNTDVGRDALLTIQAQLSVMEDADPNLVDKILIILKSLLEDNTKAIQDVKDDQARANKELENRTDSNLKSEQALKDKIAGAKEKQAAFEAKNAQLESNLADANKAKEAFVSNLSDLEADNEKKLEAYKASVKKHDDIIEALRKARELIMQLSTADTNFLQLNKDQILEQVAHHMKKVGKHGLKHSLLQLTLKISQQGIQADQEKVSTVISIIDDLLEFEAKSKSLEYQIEQRRKLMYESKKASILANEHRIDGKQKEAVADHKTNQIRIEEASADITGWTSRLAELGVQKKDLSMYYVERLQSLKLRLSDLEDFNKLLLQVIAIFESDSLQSKDVKQAAGN